MDSSLRASEIVSDSGFQLWSVKPHLIMLANPSATQKWTYHRWHVHTGEWENGREQMQLTIAFDSDWFRMWHEVSKGPITERIDEKFKAAAYLLSIALKTASS